MIRFLYNLLFPIALIAFMPGYLAKLLRRGNFRHKLGQRFGLYDESVRSRIATVPRTWIHAVSVGEVAIALKLARKLKQIDQTFACILTTTTTTGFAVANQEPCDWIEVMYNPLDFYPVVRRAFAVINPVQIILVEAEVWPNLVAIARARRIPVALVNARLSRRSELRFLRFHRFVAPTFRCLDLVCVQELDDVERWSALGIPSERIKHVGSVKYDPEGAKIDSRVPAEVMATFGIGDGRPVLFGGSTHAGEEEILASVFQKLRTEIPRCVLVIAPRHIERVPEIRARLERMSLTVALRSQAAEGALQPIDCLILDTTGELQDWYSIATVVFIGKSLTARGGQNPVEPILAGKPVVFGPHMENFSALAHTLVEKNAAVQVPDADSLEQNCARLLRNPEAGARLIANAEMILAVHRGATERTAVLVRQLRLAARK